MRRKRLIIMIVLGAVLLPTVSALAIDDIRPIKLRRSTNFNLFAVREDMQQFGITNADLTSCLGDLETAYQRLVGDLGFREPFGRKWRGKIVVRLSDFAREGEVGVGTPGYVMRDEGILHLNIRYFWFTYEGKQNSTYRLFPCLVAHELFHLIQFSYDRFEAPWFKEATANWAEAQVHPEHLSTIRDECNFMKYAPHALNEAGLDPAGDLITKWGRPYGASLFFRFLSQADQQGPDFVRRLWEYCENVEGPSAEMAMALLLEGRQHTGREVDQRKGGVIASVAGGGPADQAGLRPGDAIVTIADIPISCGKQVPFVEAALAMGRHTVVRVRRANELFHVRPLVGSQELPPGSGTMKGSLGLAMAPDPGNTAFSWENLSRNRLPPLFHPNDSLDAIPQLFTAMGKFAVAMALMEAAPAGHRLVDVPSFIAGAAGPGKTYPPRGLDPEYRRPNSNDVGSILTFAYEEAKTPDDAACFIEKSIGDDLLSDMYLSAAGLGTRFITVGRSGWLPEDTPLQVEVLGANGGLLLQAMSRHEGDAGWWVHRADYDKSRKIHRVVVPRFDQTAANAWIAINRFDNSSKWRHRKKFKVMISAVRVPAVLSVEAEQGGEKVFFDTWTERFDADRIVTGRTHRRQDDPLRGDGGEVTLTVRFSQPVEAVKAREMFELDGNALALRPVKDEPLVYRAVVPADQLLPKTGGHKLDIRAQAHMPGMKLPLPLDEDPATIADLIWDTWENYERDDKVVTVIIGEGSVRPPRFTLTTRNSTTGPMSLQLLVWGHLKVEGWKHLPCTAEACAPFNTGIRPESYIWWLLRLDYDGHTFYQPIYLYRSADETNRQITVPVNRLGRIPVKATVYTGGPGSPCFAFDAVLDVPEPRKLEPPDAGTLAQRDDSRRQMEEMVRTSVDQAPNDTYRHSFMAMWINAKANEINEDVQLFGHGYLFKNADGLLGQVEERLKQRPNGYFPARPTDPLMMNYPVSPHEAIEMKGELLGAQFRFDELDGYLRELQMEYQSAPPEAIIGGIDDLWFDLAKFYVQYKADPEHAAWLMERHIFMDGTRDNMVHIDEDIAFYRQVRAFFPPEAFVE